MTFQLWQSSTRRGGSAFSNEPILPFESQLAFAGLQGISRAWVPCPTVRSFTDAHRLHCLQCFNSRTCQLVLGAGAMRIAGLKSITAKHLALSCQCINAQLELHPALAQALSAGLSVSHRALLTPEFTLLQQVGRSSFLSVSQFTWIPDPAA